MGCIYSATCNVCGFQFQANELGGGNDLLLHCDACGSTVSVDYDRIPEIVQDFWSEDRRIGTKAWAENQQRYNAQLDSLVGKCKCGGCFRIEAKPRCPNCLSDDFSEDPGGTIMWYD